MERRAYPPEVHRKVLDLIEEGRTVAQVAHDRNVRVALRLAGWAVGRQVDTRQIQEALVQGGFEVVSPAMRVFAEYSGLTVRSEDGRRSVRIYGPEVAREEDPEWCVAYAEGIGRPVTPIAESSHMVIVVDSEGMFWGAFDDLYGELGSTFEEMVDEVLSPDPPRPFDRTVPEP